MGQTAKELGDLLLAGLAASDAEGQVYQPFFIGLDLHFVGRVCRLR